MAEIHEEVQIAGQGAGVTGGTAGPATTLEQGANLPVIADLSFDINVPDNRAGSSTTPPPTKNILKNMPPYFIMSNPA